MYMYVDQTHPSLTVSGSTTLALNNNTIIIDSAAPLPQGTYPLITLPVGGTITTNGTFTVSGPGIAIGYAGNILINGNQASLQVILSYFPSSITLSPIPPSQTYGSVYRKSVVYATPAPLRARQT